jgi:raffinose/stachyose/melibiose transport system substrate-binding protein
MRLDEESDRGAEDGSERRMSRLDFAKLVGGGIGAMSFAGALAPVASAQRGLGWTHDSARAIAGKSLSFTVQSSDLPGFQAVAKQTYGRTAGAVPVKISQVPDNGWQIVVPRELAAGTAGDIVEVQPGGGTPLAIETLVPSHYLMDLSDQPWVKKIPKSVLSVCSVNGKVYFAPIRGGVMVVFYNKAMFNQVGVTVPTTWPEFLAVCEKLKAAGKIPIWLDATNASNGGVNSLFITYPLAAATDAGTAQWPTLHKKGKVSFSKSGWVQALNNYVLLYKSGYFSPNPTGGAPLSQLANNEAAMYCFVGEGLSTAQTGFGKANTGAFVLPNANTAAKVVASAGSGAGLAVNAKTKNPDLAKAFMAAATTPLGVKLDCAIGGGIPLMPSKPGAVAQCFVPNVLPIVQAGRTSTYYDQLWPNTAVQKALVSGSQDLLTGQQTVAQVLSAMDDAYNTK